MPGVSMIQPGVGRAAASMNADVEVCRPAAGHRVDDADVAVRVGHQRVDQRGLADAAVAEQHAGAARPAARAARARSPPRCVTTHGTPERAGRSPAASRGRRGRTWSGTAAASCPASYAATRARSISRGCGSGSASAVTTTSWSALATITRSTGSSSSAVRRSVVIRSLTSTMRARLPVVAGDVADDAHPVADDDALAAQRAGLHRHDRRGRRPAACSGPGRR